MKILRIIARLNVGGPARHVTLLNAGLQSRGHQTLLVYGALDEGEGSLEGPAVERHIPLEHHNHLGRRVTASDDVRALIELVRLVFREKPDVVHTHTAKAGTLGRLAALAYNATRSTAHRALVVHTFHGHVFEGYFSGPVSRVVRITERALARATDLVITISARQQHDIVERFGVAPARKTVVVPLGLELESLLASPEAAPNMRQELGIAADDVVVGFAGRMVPIKDLPTLVKAFASAWSAVPSLRLVLAGNGPERGRAEALAAELGVTHRVHFTGWVHDLPRFYATVDVFALSSINEGTPVAVIEAMAAGRVVVATAVGGVPDVVDSGHTGLLVPASDPQAMSSALVRLATSPDHRAAMGAAGRAAVGPRYSHVRLVDDIEKLYGHGLARKREAKPAGQAAHENT